MSKLKCAVIGLGRISIMHLDAIEKFGDCELVACCDIKPDRLEEACNKYGVRGYADYREMFEKEHLDAVHICLPHYLHVPVSRYALEHGVNVICEKPMAIGYEEAAKTVEYAKSKNLLYAIIFQCRYNAASVLVKNAVQSGKLGKVLTASSSLTWERSDEYYSHSDWKGTWDKEGGGVVIDQAIHSIDLVNWIVDDEVVNVQSSNHNRHHQIVHVEDTAEGLIEYKGGTLYSFYCMNNYAINEPIRIQLVCENGVATFNYNEAEIKYNDGTVERVVAGEKREKIKGSKDYWGTSHEIQIAQFYNACLGREELDISGEKVLKTHKLICDIYDVAGMRPKEITEATKNA